MSVSILPVPLINWERKMMCTSLLFRQWPKGFYSLWGQGLVFLTDLGNRNPEPNRSVKLIFFQGFLPIFAPSLPQCLCFRPLTERGRSWESADVLFLQGKMQSATGQNCRCAPVERSLSSLEMKQEVEQGKWEWVWGRETRQVGGTSCSKTVTPSLRQEATSSSRAWKTLPFPLLLHLLPCH